MSTGFKLAYKRWAGSNAIKQTISITRATKCNIRVARKQKEAMTSLRLAQYLYSHTLKLGGGHAYDRSID
jgi:hypothetical protein